MIGNEIITIDVEDGTHDGVYDVWISNEGSSGAHYADIDAKAIGENVADLIDTLEEADSGKSYLKSEGKRLPVTGSDAEELVGQMIDIFEDYLSEGDAPDDNTVYIKGCDYDRIAACVRDTLVGWGIIAKEV